MSTRRERTKSSRVPSETAGNKPVMINTWLENLGKYLLDISKYVITGVVIASLFKDVEDKSAIYLIGTSIAVATLIVGLVLTNKKKKKEE